MNILVLMKEVPDMEKVRFDRDRGVVDRASAPAEMNPFDESALQAALDLKARYDGVRVTAMTMGPARAVNTLRDAYARGVDELVLVTDKAFGGADTFATASVLAEAIGKDYDLIFCGEKSVDGDTGQVGAETAALLEIPHACYADRIEKIGDGWVRVSVENLCGNRQIRSMAMPALISVTKNAGKLKLPTVERKLASLQAEPRILDLAALPHLTREHTGLHGSPTRVASIEVPGVVARESVMYRDDADGFLEKIEEVLRRKGVVEA